MIKKVVIDANVIAQHCYAGAGRTGTLLASLQLREMIDKLNLEELQKLQKTSKEYVYIKQDARFKDERDYPGTPCSRLTAQAIWYVRQFEPSTRRTIPGCRAVETIGQMQSLEELEKHLVSQRIVYLLKQHKEYETRPATLGSKKSGVVDPIDNTRSMVTSLKSIYEARSAADYVARRRGMEATTEDPFCVKQSSDSGIADHIVGTSGMVAARREIFESSVVQGLKEKPRNLKPGR